MRISTHPARRDRSQRRTVPAVLAAAVLAVALAACGTSSDTPCATP